MIGLFAYNCQYTFAIFKHKEANMTGGLLFSMWISSHWVVTEQAVSRVQQLLAYHCQGYWATQLPTVHCLSECWALFFCPDTLEHWAQALYCRQHNSTDCKHQFHLLKTTIRQQQTHPQMACAVKNPTTSLKQWAYILHKIGFTLRQTVNH